jgi:hypothetical protein
MIPRPCRSCRRLNPYQATYCYFDGVPLETGVRGAAAGGSERFPKPFVFPSGHACGSFLELAHACRENWNEARRLLKDGEFLPFLAGLGRIDLVQAAERAAAHPDLDRGLDDLLVTLPGSQAKAACLEISNAEIDVGSVAVGQDRKVTLTIVNTGERLLTGVARGEDCLWLGLHNPQLNEKTFRAPGGGEWQLQLHIRGQQLRARPQPQVGLVVIESNGGVAQVDVRIRVPVTPFPDGVLKGAQTPRQLAEKAKTNPQEVAALLENGSVERWFQRNGWTYPITVPRVSGLAAVQQYFEALGLTTPPRVEPKAVLC